MWLPTTSVAINKYNTSYKINAQFNIFLHVILIIFRILPVIDMFKKSKLQPLLFDEQPYQISSNPLTVRAASITVMYMYICISLCVAACIKVKEKMVWIVSCCAYQAFCHDLSSIYIHSVLIFYGPWNNPNSFFGLILLFWSSKAWKMC